jgi:hypothetical protein
MESGGAASSKVQRVEQIESIFATKKLTLHQVSRRSAILFGKSSPYFVPHNLYYEIRQRTFSPSLFQLFAFSQISNYRLSEWIRVFGFDLETIPRLQIQLPAPHTILLDSSLVDPDTRVRWFRNVPSVGPVDPVEPLARLLSWGESRRVSSLTRPPDNRFLYAHIGKLDALAFPDVLAGSIVRINSAVGNNDLPKRSGEISARLFLIEHRHRLFCCRIRRAVDKRFELVSTQLSYPQVEFTIPEEATLRGVADLEIRSVLMPPEQPDLTFVGAVPSKADVMSVGQRRLSSLLRHARLRMGLSFRAASERSRKLADLLGDQHYFLSSGALSDYEADIPPPRRFQKFLSFCVVYAIQFAEIVRVLGLDLQEAGAESIPAPLVGRYVPPEGTLVSSSSEPGFLGELMTSIEEVPFFLRGALKHLSGLSNLSLRDCYWVGETRQALHPSLSGGLIVVVNRHKKRPSEPGPKPLWQQPLSVVLRRNGKYFCAYCSIEDRDLVVHSYAEGFHTVEHLHERDAEIIGQIATIVRRLP